MRSCLYRLSLRYLQDIQRQKRPSYPKRLKWRVKSCIESWPGWIPTTKWAIHFSWSNLYLVFKKTEENQWNHLGGILRLCRSNFLIRLRILDIVWPLFIYKAFSHLWSYRTLWSDHHLFYYQELELRLYPSLLFVQSSLCHHLTRVNWHYNYFIYLIQIT